jgi:hypothetical protein
MIGKGLIGVMALAAASWGTAALADDKPTKETETTTTVEVESVPGDSEAESATTTTTTTKKTERERSAIETVPAEPGEDTATVIVPSETATPSAPAATAPVPPAPTNNKPAPTTNSETTAPPLTGQPRPGSSMGPMRIEGPGMSTPPPSGGY